MKKTPSSTLFTLLGTLCLGVCLCLVGCEISGGDETVRQIALNIAGTYQNNSGIASNQSGSRVTSLTLQQSGDQLDGIDNLGLRWGGTIGRTDDTTASITLSGLTSTGVQVVITGDVRVEGTQGVMTGLWVEPVIRASVSAEASVASAPTPTPTQDPSPDATPTVTPVPLSI